MSVVAAPDFDLRAYPTVTETAGMLDVNKSTVSKRAVRSETVNGTRRLPAAEVLRLASEQQKVPITQVAQGLIDYASAHAPGALVAVRDEVQEFFAARRSRPTRVTREEFLGEARTLLDDAAYHELEQRYDEAHGRRPATHLVSEFDGVDA